jgi:hypothetical protein
LAVSQDFAQDLAGLQILHHSSHRHRDDQILSAFAMLGLTSAVSPSGGTKLATEMKLHQGIQTFLALKGNASPSTAIAAVGPALGPGLLSQETEAAVPAAAAGNRDFNLV